MSNTWVPCVCGEYAIAPGTSMELAGIKHRTDGPCYHCDEYGDEKVKMNFTTYVRKPFAIQAVEVTEANIEEVAKYVGDLREKEDGTPYILVDPRLVPNVERVYPGYFMTRMGENVRCYARKVFNDQFVKQTEQMQDFIELVNP